MSTYMKTNALNTAFQLLKVIASGKLLQEQITEAEAELHIHFDQKQLLTANSALLDLLEKIKAETAHKLKNDTDLLNSYFRKITIAQKDYENVSLFLFLTEHPAEYLDYPDFASYVDFLLNLTEARRCQLFLTMIKRYNHMYLRDTDSDEQTDNVSSEKNISTLDVVAAIMEMDVPMEIRWKIQYIFVHWKSHLEKALPLLNYAYQTLIDFEPQLELCAQNFISYWTNEITNQGGIVPFAEHLFPLNNLPDNPFGYKLYISFFLPFELGFHADLSAENKVLSSPYEIVLGILYGEYVKPQNPYAPDYIEDSEAYINALKLLSDKRRFEIMSYLSEKPAYAGELVKYSGLTAATISHHMSQLAEASLIRLEKIDTKVYYSVNKEMLQKCFGFYQKKLLHP